MITTYTFSNHVSQCTHVFIDGCFHHNHKSVQSKSILLKRLRGYVDQQPNAVNYDVNYTSILGYVSYYSLTFQSAREFRSFN